MRCRLGSRFVASSSRYREALRRIGCLARQDRSAAFSEHNHVSQLLKTVGPHGFGLRLLHLLFGQLLTKVLLELHEEALVRLVALGVCVEVQRALADAKEMLDRKMPQVRLRCGYVWAQGCLQVDLAAQKALEERPC